MKSLVKQAARILKAQDYLVKQKFFHIDFHSYRIQSQDGEVESSLCWHKDDFGATDYKVHTLILYLQKDTTLKGGDLEYKIGAQLMKQVVSSKLMLAMSGDLEHFPEAMSGFGARDSIVIQFKRKRKRKPKKKIKPKAQNTAPQL